MSHLEEMQRSLSENGWRIVTTTGAFMARSGPLWARRERDGWVYGVITTEQHLNPAGVVHGGMLTTLMDHALSTIAWEAASRTPCVTAQFDSHFLAAVPAGVLIEARGRVVRQTSSLLFLRGDLTVNGSEVLVAQALMKIRPSSPH